MTDSVYNSAWLDDVYMPKLHSAERELVFEHHDVWESGDRFSEYFLQIVWNERYLNAQLKTTAGGALRVIHPGTWNVSAGPDFHNASVLLEGKLLRGDVEIHQRTSDWLHHGHDSDERYKNVVLHVVWEDDVQLPEGPPHTLVLSGSLLPAWHLLLHDVEDASYPYARQVGAGQCASRWRQEEDQGVQSLLMSAGLARLAAKGARIARLCAERGEGQALYELFFECLGFRANRQPFRELAELVPLDSLRGHRDWTGLEARLFGAAGLLPDVTQEPVLREWLEPLKKLWDIWWTVGGQRFDLPWCFAGTRPFNSPQRRLVAGIQWLFQVDFQPNVWLKHQAESCKDGRQLLKALLAEMPSAEPWTHFKDFKRRLKTPVSLLGGQRLKDIAANLYLPYLVSLEEREDGDGGLADLARQAYVMLSPGQANRHLQEAIHRFLTPPSRARDVLKCYCQQQGLMDIYRNFCLVFSGDCALCPFAAVTQDASEAQPPDLQDDSKPSA